MVPSERAALPVHKRHDNTGDDVITDTEAGVSNVATAPFANFVAHLDGSYQHMKYDNVQPLPAVSHLVLGERILQDKAVFVVGDVHGCLHELKVLVKMAQDLETNVLFVFVGDLVSKGPHSVKVLEFIRSGEIECYAVRGNHEETAMNDYNHLKANPKYVPKSKRAWIQEMMPDDYKFMASLPFTISMPSLNAIVVHAGLNPGVSLENQSLPDLTSVRNIIQEDSLQGRGLILCEKVAHGVPWSSLWRGPEHVYFGHDARRGLQQKDFSTCLDTGCVFGFRLTGVFINGCKKMLSVAAQKVYYLGKPGK